MSLQRRSALAWTWQEHHVEYPAHLWFRWPGVLLPNAAGTCSDHLEEAPWEYLDAMQGSRARP